MTTEKILQEITEKLIVLNNQIDHLPSGAIQELKVYERYAKLLGIENELRAVVKLEQEAGVKG